MEHQPHDELCAVFQEGATPKDDGTQRKTMVLVPRGCFKSTIGATGLCLFLLAHNPNIRILISSHTSEQSEERLDEIKYHIEKNARLKALFGDWRAGAPMWTGTGITVGIRTKALKDPSIATTGTDASVTGSHYDVIIADDLHNRQNSETDAGRKKVRGHLQEFFPLLETNGCLLVIGTRWHRSDIYGGIINKPQDWKILVRAAWLDDGSLYFPSRLSEKALDSLRRDLEDKFFAVWYTNDPIDPSSKIFPKIWLRFFEGTFANADYPVLTLADGNQIPVSVTLSIDPAISSRKRADFTGITVVATDANDNWYVLEAIQAKGGPERVIEEIVYLIRLYNPRLVTIETIGFQEAYKMLLLQRFKADGLRVPLKEYRESTRASKTSRIESMQPRVKQHKMFVRRGLESLLQQLDDYPESEHDDLIDSLAQHIQIASPKFAGLRPPVLDEEEAEFEEERRRNETVNGAWMGRSSRRVA